MSEIRATTISNAAGTGPVTLTGQSAAKAWGQFNGTGTVAISDSKNFSSITDAGTGAYTLNFTSNMVNGSYATNGSTGESNTNGFVRVGGSAASNIFINSKVSTSGSTYDDAKIYISAHGDLA